MEPMFPSFAASPNHSPQRPPSYQSPNYTLQQSITKITIELPESLVETTIEENSCYESSLKQEEGQNIKVYCRFRPAMQPTQLKHDRTMIDDGENRYSFDGIFGGLSSQEEVYSVVAGRHIDTFFKGQNSTLFTYGQTGSGKTYTMFGQLKNKEGYGLIPRALEDIFKRKSKQEQITCSILEIYN